MQDELSRAEANLICNTDNQYIVPTSGGPLRGLIQDHVASGVKLTSRDTFLSKAEFQQLLYIAVCGLDGTEIVGRLDNMVMPPPAIMKPKQRFSVAVVMTAYIPTPSYF
jgi:DNA-directed RNA polymerase I subunit RPA1